MKMMSPFFVLFAVVCLSTSTFAVGKRTVSEYEKSKDGSSTMNIRFSPVPLIYGGISAQLDYKINEKVTVGPEFAYLNLSARDASLKGSDIGIQGRLFFDQFGENSPYATAGIVYSRAEVSVLYLGDEYEGSPSGVALKVGGGYHWFWESFNMNLGAVLLASSAFTIEVKNSHGDSKSIDMGRPFFIEYTLGWMF